MRSNSDQGQPIPKIGVFLERLTTQYHEKIWLGMAETAQKHNLHLITFVVGDADTAVTPKNSLYDFIDANLLDGAILLKATELESMTENGLAWTSRLKDLPMIRVGISYNDGPSVVVNNHVATRQLMEHLIVDHGCRHIAFISALNDHPDAYVRFLVYQEMMQKYDLPQRITKGDFTRPSGQEAMIQLLDESETKIDAVFAANDSMALGAMEVLWERGYDIPEDILVVGFDDISEGEFTRSPLTTIRQPLYRMGQLAVEMIQALLKGDNCPFEEVLPADLVIRQSCGCLPKSVLQAGLDTAVLFERSSLEEISQQWLQILEESFLADLQSRRSNSFLLTLNNLIRQSSSEQVDSTRLQNLLTSLRSRLQSHFEESQKRKRAENLWHQARVLMADASFRTQADNSATIARHTIELSDVIQQISSSFNIIQFRKALVQQLPKSGVYKCLMTLHDAGSQRARNKELLLPQFTRTLLFFDEESHHFPLDEEAVIKSNDLIANNYFSNEKPEIGIVQALYQKNRPVGLILFFVRPTIDNLYVYELLQSQISNVLMGTMLVRQIQDHAADLESEVARRTENLQRANSQLKQYADELERSNRELKVVAYVASHDLQEPLRKIQVFGDRLAAIAEDSLDEKGQDYLNRMQNAASRMQSLIQDLLMFSRVTTRQLVIENVDLAQVVQTVLNEMNSEIQRLNAHMTVGDLPMIEADKYQMLLLFKNLISNGLKFRRAEAEPKLHIRCDHINGRRKQIRLQFEDNGIGFDMVYDERIFNAFQRLHGRDQYDGSGIGLAVCRRIIERHHGQISVESQIGKGSVFTVHLPFKHPQG